ncbi:hypothetical protein N7457_000006 [Penicillium paradoxum]|uniref:uncharacterized protein n=1 Tax=Penicillium paradoxum TaxID=176176 RepID=UPI0025473DA9|nr:uncharacterized protein N7457_000006 [Penicillium paradoxum]KAJ5793407.1 hypothetical protein N7457_000006 [Penicillium paradoxum]
MPPSSTIAKIIANVIIFTMAANSRSKSFRDIVRNNPGFLINPVQWTSRHLDLVGCRFEDVGTPPVHTESTQNDHRKNESRNRCLTPPSDAEVIAMNPFPTMKHRSLISILVDKERTFAYSSKGAPFYFQGRPVHRPEYTVFHRREKIVDHIHNGSPPLVGYVHYTSVNGDRRRHFEPRPGSRGVSYSDGASIQKRLAQTTPKEWTEDPYFMCHLLALAQLQERRLDWSKPTVYTSRLLVTHVLDREYILYYEAQVTTELLNVLRNPKDATSPMKWPTIRRRKVSYKPYHTFAGRLIAELVASSPLPSNCLLNSVDDVDGAIEHCTKRPHEQNDSGAYKVRRISKR